MSARGGSGLLLPSVTGPPDTASHCNSVGFHGVTPAFPGPLRLTCRRCNTGHSARPLFSKARRVYLLGRQRSVSLPRHYAWPTHSKHGGPSNEVVRTLRGCPGTRVSILHKGRSLGHARHPSLGFVREQQEGRTVTSLPRRRAPSLRRRHTLSGTRLWVEDVSETPRRL